MIYFRFLAYSKSYCFILFVSFKSFTLKRKFHLSDLESRDPQVSLNLCDWISVSDESLHLLFEIFWAISRLWLKHQPRPWGQGWVLIQRSLASKGPCHGCFTSFNRELKQRQRRRRRKRQQAIGLDWQNNNFARRASLFFVHFFSVTAQLRREKAYFQDLWWTPTQDNDGFLFLFLTFKNSCSSRKNCLKQRDLTTIDWGFRSRCRPCCLSSPILLIMPITCPYSLWNLTNRTMTATA